MSQRIQITFTCPYCDTKAETEIFRTIWGEKPQNRELVFTDKINRLTCVRCGRTSFAASSLMYTNAELHFAVWYEPEYDPQIDAEMIKYAEIYKQKGPAYSYLQAPPRVRDWEEFKAMIRRYECGEFVTESRRFREAMAQQQPVQQGRGCLGMLAALTGLMIAGAFVWRLY
jgi:hypothetical protein